jgi:uncharacterized damage-inducible protein DinB
MFRRVDDFRVSWKSEAEATLKIFNAIPDSYMGQSVNEGHRDLRRMAWHVVESVIEMPARFGMKVEGGHLMKDGFITDPPSTMEAIANVYAAASESLMKGLESWSDADLEREDDMYGEAWKRGVSLMVLIVHQVHHRGQMTVLMRQAGLEVPGIYGPAKEGWSAYGMPAPKV